MLWRGVENYVFVKAGFAIKCGLFDNKFYEEKNKIFPSQANDQTLDMFFEQI